MVIRFSCPHCGAVAQLADHCAGRVASCARCGSFVTVPYGSMAATPKAVSAKSPFTSADDDLLFIDGPPQRSRWQRWRRWTVALTVCAVCLFAFIYWIALPARESARQMSCSNRLKQLGLALHNYHDVYGCFPPAYTTDEEGRPMHSWRVLILPFIESGYYRDYDLEEPWDSPGNLKLMRLMPETFRCPSVDAPEGFTNYVVVIGNPECFPQTMFTPDRWLSFGDIADGPVDTIMLAEVRRAVPWTKPGADLHFDEMTFRINDGPASISSNHPGLANVVMADGAVEVLNNWNSADGIKSLLQPANDQRGEWLERIVGEGRTEYGDADRF